MTRPQRAQASGNTLHVTFAVKDGSWLGTTLSVHMDATICADCGHVDLFAQPKGLEQLRSTWAQLE